MGNTLASVIEDITEDGNTWKDDKIKLPLPYHEKEDIYSSTLERFCPSLVVAPIAISSRTFSSSPSSTSSDGSDEYLRCTRQEVRFGFDCMPTRDCASSRSVRGPLVQQDPQQAQPSQLVLQPGCGGHGGSRQRLGRWQCAVWRPVHQCRTLRGHALLTAARLAELRPHLPITTRFASRWRLLYSPRVHGVSLGTFYRQCQAWPSETLLLVEDSKGTVFGGFASNTWQVFHQQLHSGQPECFVFSCGSLDPHLIEIIVDAQTERLGFICNPRLLITRVRPESWAERAGLKPGDELIKVDGACREGFDRERLDHVMRTQRPLQLTFYRRDGLVVYPWAGRNQCFMFADHEGISMGGGQNFAFWIDKDFLMGTSAACETFATPGPLASAEEFVVRNFECWAFDHSLEAVEAHTPGDDQELSWNTQAIPDRIQQQRLLREQAMEVRHFEVAT